MVGETRSSRGTLFTHSEDALPRDGRDALLRCASPRVFATCGTVGTRSRAILRCTFPRVFATCGTIGTRSRAIRGSRCDDRVGCSASDGRCAPARPALHVSTRLLTFLPRALASTDCFRSFPLFAPPVNVLRWTRRKPSTIRRGAPDVLSDNLRRLARERVPTILRATPDRAAVRPVRVQRRIALQHPFSSPTPHVPFRRTFFSSPPPAPASPKFARPSPVPASDNSKHLRRAL